MAREDNYVVYKSVIRAFLDRLFDRSLNEREHRIAIDQLQAVLPCKLYMTGPIVRREINVDGSLTDGGPVADYAVLVFVEQGQFEKLPVRLRNNASYIEEVKRDGSGIVYKSHVGKTGPIPRTTKPDFKHERRTAWDYVLDD